MSPWHPEYYAMPAESLQQDNTEARLWGELFAFLITGIAIGLVVGAPLGALAMYLKGF